jgi:hypothetical protein
VSILEFLKFLIIFSSIFIVNPEDKAILYTSVVPLLNFTEENGKITSHRLQKHAVVSADERNGEQRLIVKFILTDRPVSWHFNIIHNFTSLFLIFIIFFSSLEVNFVVINDFSQFVIINNFFIHFRFH